MRFQYAIVNKLTNQTVETFPVTWFKDEVMLKNNINETLHETRKKIQQYKKDIQEIKEFQESLFETVKSNILVRIKNTSNLIEVLEEIDSLRDEYTKKTFTTYREDEVYFIKTTLSKLESFEKFLIPYTLLEQELYGELSF